jgi:branched-chain amino acid transport system substrate-binding protein
MAESGREAISGQYYTTHWHPEAPFPAGRAVAEAYRAAYGESPLQPDAILAHDAVMVLADAVRRAGSLDREKIVTALARTRDFPGGTGTITLDENRNPTGKDVSIMRFAGGQAVFPRQLQVSPERAVRDPPMTLRAKINLPSCSPSWPWP